MNKINERKKMKKMPRKNEQGQMKQNDENVSKSTEGKTSTARNTH